MKISCIIIDDEPLARKGLTEYITEVDFLDLKAACENAVMAYKILNQQKIDLIFLDIKMPKITGIDFLKTLQDKPMIIFTTAFSEYALQGYELDVLDYLVKPIAFERFLKACNKAMDVYRNKNNLKQGESLTEKYFYVRCDNSYEKIAFDDLLFAEAMENYIVLQTKFKKFISYLTFKMVEDYLPPDDFIKVHRSFIVSVSKIDQVTGNEIKIGEHSIPISRSLKDEIMNRIVNNKLIKR
ncbi:MAG: LytR/AlgR family response regulator transcription factor [Chitinophagaceae bacterium]